MKKEDEIIKKIDKLDHKFDKLEKKFDGRFDRHQEVILNNSERIQKIEENMVTKKDHEQVINYLDNISTHMAKNQENITFTIEWVKRLQLQVDKIDLKG